MKPCSGRPSSWLVGSLAPICEICFSKASMRSASVAAQVPLPPSAAPASAATICAALRPKAVFELALIYPGEEQLGSIVGPRKGAPNLPAGSDQCDLEIVQQVLIVVPVGDPEHPRYPARAVFPSTHEMPV